MRKVLLVDHHSGVRFTLREVLLLTRPLSTRRALIAMFLGAAACGAPPPPVPTQTPPSIPAPMRAAPPTSDAGTVVASSTAPDTPPLGAPRLSAASYVNEMHRRIHPLYAEEFLRALDALYALPAWREHPGSDLSTDVEIVLSAADGRLVRLDVVRSSGVTEFDVVATNAVRRAAPFGAAPAPIASYDGSVHVRWRFHRDPYEACSARNATPIILAAPPEPASPNAGGAPTPR